MPNSNDVELVGLYSAATGLDVEDDEPNTVFTGGTPAASFDLHLEAVAGNAIGNNGANYRLMITCIDDTLAAPNATMSPGTLNQEFDAADGWMPAGGAGNFLKEQVFTITVPSNVSGHVFHCIATLVGGTGGLVSFTESNRFILE